MKKVQPHSLRWRLVCRLVGLQAAMLALLVLVVIAALWGSGHLVSLESEDDTIDELRDAVIRESNGASPCAIRPCSRSGGRRLPISGFRSGTAKDIRFHRAGCRWNMPASAMRSMGSARARLGWNILDGMRPTARMKWIDTPAGNIQILTGQGGAVSWRRIGHAALTLFLGLVLPIVALMTLTTFVATPVVVRRTLAGLDRAAAQAEKIDIDGRGARLPLQDVPSKSFRWYRPSMMRYTALMRVTNDTSGFLSMRRTNSVRRSLSFRRGWNRCHSAPARDACSKMLRVYRRWPISFWTCNASTSRPTGFPPSISSPSGGK